MLGPLLLLSLAAAPVPAAELGYMSAGDLAARCNDGSGAGISTCVAYVAAAHDMMRAYEIWLNLREFCLPPGTPQLDLAHRFTAYLAAHPAAASAQAASVVAAMLKSGYPCAASPLPAAKAADRTAAQKK